MIIYFAGCDRERGRINRGLFKKIPCNLMSSFFDHRKNCKKILTDILKYRKTKRKESHAS